MECDFGFICDYAEQDAKLHAVGMGWDMVYATGVPTMHPVMTFVAKLRGSLAEAGVKDMSLRIIDADVEDVIPPVEQQINFEVKPGQLSAAATILVNMYGLQFKKFGQYAIHLVVQGVEMKVVHFTVATPPTTG